MLEIEKDKFIKCVLWWCVLISFSCELLPACDIQYFLVARKWNDLEQSTMAHKCGNTTWKSLFHRLEKMYDKWKNKELQNNQLKKSYVILK